MVGSFAEEIDNADYIAIKILEKLYFAVEKDRFYFVD